MRVPARLSADVGPVLESVVELAAHSVGSQPIQSRTEMVPDVPAIACDPEQIKKVVLNLTINLQAMPEGGEIVLSTRVDGGRSS